MVLSLSRFNIVDPERVKILEEKSAVYRRKMGSISMARLIQANPGAEAVSIPMPGDPIVEAHFPYRRVQVDAVTLAAFRKPLNLPLCQA